MNWNFDQIFGEVANFFDIVFLKFWTSQKITRMDFSGYHLIEKWILTQENRRRYSEERSVQKCGGGSATQIANFDPVLEMPDDCLRKIPNWKYVGENGKYKRPAEYQNTNNSQSTTIQPGLAYFASYFHLLRTFRNFRYVLPTACRRLAESLPKPCRSLAEALPKTWFNF